MEHNVVFSRRPLGRGAIAGSGMRYGTDARCTGCGWKDYTNDKPPSRSWPWQRAAEKRHAEEATHEWTLNHLKLRYANYARKLLDAIERDAEFNIEMYADDVKREAYKIRAELREMRQEANEAEARG